jgi:hypothetical protein
MSTAGCRNQPVIVIRGHQDQFPPTMSCDLNRLAPGLVLNLAEISLELDCRSVGHIRSSESRLSVYYRLMGRPSKRKDGAPKRLQLSAALP